MTRRLLAAGFAAPLLLSIWLATPGSAARPTCAFASGVHHVAVVVEHGNGAVLTGCVAFGADQVTGEQLMQLSGIEYATTGYGGLGKAVCQVDHEPASYPPSCWTASSRYWARDIIKPPVEVTPRGTILLRDYELDHDYIRQITVREETIA